MTLPQNEARLHDSFFFFFIPFFFFAMALFLGSLMKFGRVGSSAGLIALDLSLALAPLPRGTMTQSRFRPQ